MTLQYGETPYLGGPLGSIKVNEACHFMHLAKVAEMKSISKPQLPIEPYIWPMLFLNS